MSNGKFTISERRLKQIIQYPLLPGLLHLKKKHLFWLFGEQDTSFNALGSLVTYQLHFQESIEPNAGKGF